MNKNSVKQNKVTSKTDKKSSGGSSSQTMMNSSLMQQKAKNQQSMFGNNPIQKQENKTGIPDNLKSGMENLSGYSLDDVKVHYNSPKPATVQAHAFAQGSEIHIASGQEKHLPHELGHVIQQKQGRVQPTSNVGGVAVNDSPSLEKEATSMGSQALQMKKNNSISLIDKKINSSTQQQFSISPKKMWNKIRGGHEVSDDDSTTSELRDDSISGGIEGVLGLHGAVGDWQDAENKSDKYDAVSGGASSVTQIGESTSSGIMAITGNQEGKASTFGKKSGIGGNVVGAAQSIKDAIYSAIDICSSKKSTSAEDVLKFLTDVLDAINSVMAPFKKFENTIPWLDTATSILSTISIMIYGAKSMIQAGGIKKQLTTMETANSSIANVAEEHRKKDAKLANIAEVRKNDNAEKEGLESSDTDRLGYLTTRVGELDTRKEEIENNVIDNKNIGENDIKKYALMKEVYDVNTKRYKRATLNFVSEASGLATSFASGGMQTAGNIVSGATSNGAAGVRAAKQKARDIRGRKEAKGKSLNRFQKVIGVGHTDSSKTTAAKKDYRHKQAVMMEEMIFENKILDTDSDTEKEKKIKEKEDIDKLLIATGVNIKEFENKPNREDRIEMIEEAIVAREY